MLTLVLLQFGIPGAMELAVILLLALMYGLPILVIIGLFYYLRRIDQNVQELLDRGDE